MDLPSELFHLILQKVSLMDTLMNCRATCRSWRKAADAVFTSKLPLMLSLSPPERPHSGFVIKFKSDEPNLASLSAPWINDDESSTVLTESWPQSIDPSDIIRVQSVQGWLMFNKFHHVIDQDKTYSELSFFNPFSRARFKLPWLFLFSGRSPRFSQVRVVFNSAPPGSDEFVVVFLFVFCYEEYEDLIRLDNMKQRLAFIRFKQGSWIEIESIAETNNDEIFYDIAVDDGDKLYALAFKHETSVVFVLTLGDDHHDLVVERLVLLNTVKDKYVIGKHILTHGYYKPTHQLAIDTGTGELLLVLHENEIRANIVYHSTHTKGFRVYKLERSSVTWCEVFNIGDRFLLWDYTRVSFVSAKGLTLPEQFKGGNCIFFCHANTLLLFHGRPGYQFQDHDMGVFFLGDRTITHFPINSSLPFSDQNMWFTPAPE